VAVSTVGSPDHSAGGLGWRTRLPNSPIDARNFPTWSKAARIIFALSPSSAPAERVFSVLKRLFGETRSQTLADMVEGSLLLNFNNAKRRSEKEAGF
jgi:hypothetical protein